MIIPGHTPHWWSELETDIEYLIFRPDPDNRLPHEAQLAEQRLPLRRDLDAVAPDHSVVVVRGGHEYVLNSAGLVLWGITVDTPVPAGGEISRYDDGSLNGKLIDAAKNLVSLDPPPQRDVETRIADQLAEHARLHAAGLTSIRHPGGAPDQYELLAELKRRGELRIRVNFLFRARGARTAEELGFTTRDTITGGVFGPDERISREEALRALTLGNAWLSFEKDLKGSLTAGKLADLVVLSHDILTCSDEELRHARVSMTMVGGEIVYEAVED